MTRHETDAPICSAWYCLIWGVIVAGWCGPDHALAADDVKVDPTSTSAAADATADVLLSGHSYHGEAFNEGPRQAAYLMAGTGRVHFPVASSHAEVQPLIDQGLGQLHGFWYFEAERTFRQAASLDPTCAAAFWGMAMANTNNLDRAKKFIVRAVELKSHETPRVQRYIQALHDLLHAEDKQAASDDYIQSLEKIVYDYPDDIEAKAFIAVHLWEKRDGGQKIRSHLAVDALIQQVLDVEPLHPVHHYRIHLWDYEKPERALASAARCGQSAPSIAHMWHMPGHIYSRLNRYRDAVWQQEASARVDHAHMMRDLVLPDQIHNFAHNNEWLIRNLIFVGHFDSALDLALNMVELPRHPKYNLIEKSNTSSSYGRMRLLQVLQDAEMWEETLRLSRTSSLERTDEYLPQVEWLRAVGRAYYRVGNLIAGQQCSDELEDLLCRRLAEHEAAGLQAAREARAEGKSPEEITKAYKKAQKGDDGDRSRAERGLNELAGYRQLSRGNMTQAIELLEKAADVDKRFLAKLRLQQGEADKALEDLKSYADSHPGETLPLAYLAELQEAAGHTEEAQKSLERLRDLATEPDLDAVPFARLAPIAARLGWPAEWNKPASPADDVGQRPALDDLGPFRWQPSPAPQWTLVSATGENVSLADYRGRNVVVIFYLGHGCLHCAEQLHTFGPQTEAFRKAGVEIVAVSSDDAEGLKKSLEDYTGGIIPFPLLSDASLNVFRQYRAYDDFERQTLHGTFLIDAAGQIRWHDISYEPFMDAAFVLGEAKRLLGTPAASAALAHAKE